MKKFWKIITIILVAVLFMAPAMGCLGGNSSELDELRRKLEAAEQENANLRSQLAALTEIQAVLDEIRNDGEGLVEAFERILDENTSLAEELAGVEKELGELQEKYDTLGGTNANLAAQIKGLEGIRDGLAYQIGVLEQGILDKQGEITNLGNQLRIEQGRVTSLQGQLQTAQNSLDEANELVQLLSGQLQTARDRIRDLEELLGLNQGTPLEVSGFRLSQAPGIFTEAFDLTVTHENPAATIHYTIDGTEPTPGAPRILRGARNRDHIVSGTVPLDGILRIEDRKGAHWHHDSILTHFTNAPTHYGTGTPPSGAPIQQGVSYRFRAFMGDTPIGPTITTTYLVWEDDDFRNTFFNMPVIALTAAHGGDTAAASDFLAVYRDTAITTSAIRRNFNFEFFENDGNGGAYSRKWNMVGSTQLGGMGSRGNAQRTMNVHMARAPLTGVINHEVFEGLPSFTRFRLWNGGNSFWWDHMRDPFMQKSAFLGGLDVIHADYRLAVKVINGEFWGFTHIREHTSNNHFTEGRLGIPRGNAAILNTTWHPSTHTEVEESAGGRAEQGYAALNAFLGSSYTATDAALSTQAGMERLFTEFFCESNTIDYLVTMAFFQNIDWPANNLRLTWATQPDPTSDNRYMDGKWRFILHDLDRAMPLSTHLGSGWSRTIDHNLLQILRNNTSSYIFARMFRGLLRNPVFAQRIVERGRQTMQTPSGSAPAGTGAFHSTNLVPLFESMRADRYRLLPQHYQRFATRPDGNLSGSGRGTVSGSIASFTHHTERIHTFITTRQPHFENNLTWLSNQT